MEKPNDKLQSIREKLQSEEEYSEMSLLFSMYADSTRLKILNALFVEELCVTELVELLEMSQTVISHHLSTLKKTKLVRSRKKGKNVYYSLDDEHIKQIYEMAYEHVCE